MCFKYPQKRDNDSKCAILVEEICWAIARINQANLLDVLPSEYYHILNGELLKPFSAHRLLANHRTLLPNTVAGDELRISVSYPTSKSNWNSSQAGQINVSGIVPEQPMHKLWELNIR
jgi:hypothetical protein